MADITALVGNEDLATTIAKVNVIIAALNTATNTNTSQATTIASHTTKLAEIYDNMNLPSEEPEAEAAPEIPEDEITVEIDAVERTFTFNVAKFNWNGTVYVSSQVVEDLDSEDSEVADAAAALITEIVEAGSVVIEGEGSGVLTETTA